MDYEKLGVFYLGKPYDQATAQMGAEPLLYDARDLTTHAVIVGMTGSGKTGLALAMLEEALLDGIPVIAIDPKGDLGNLLLTFPGLTGAEFAPWVDAEQAAREGKTREEQAEKTAGKWRDGLAAWQQDAARIARLRAAGDIALYTPGSEAGLPLSILRSFAAPAAALQEDNEAWRDKIEAAVSGLLALIGVEADPLRSREHILISQILDRAWRQGAAVDLSALIGAIIKPPFDRVGAFDLETFFSAKDRQDLALAINTLLAAPGFAAWTQGEPFELSRLLYTADGKPRISILSIAHLSDAERMFFVTFVLGELVSWMRTQPGTSNLRALLFMDEVFGYLPPTAAPPSKKPMLTLLKQARAFGVGCIFATQNPVDLDYKALSNAGTWFLGRLQTERDKARVIEGLEGASAAAGKAFDKAAMERTLAGLTSRVFVMNNVHDDAPVVFQSRWVMSYLAGPLTRAQIAAVTAGHPSRAAVNVAPGRVAASLDAGAMGGRGAGAGPAGPTGSGTKALPPAGLAELFIGADELAPALTATAKVHYASAKVDLDVWVDVTVVAPLEPGSAGDLWASAVQIDPARLSAAVAAAPTGARYAPLPGALDAKAAAKLGDAFEGWVYRECTLTLWSAPAHKLTSRPGETVEAFAARVADADRLKREAQIDKLEAKYGAKIDRLQDKIRTAEHKVEREQAQASASTTDAAISVGTSVLGAILGRRKLSRTTVTSAAGAARRMSRTSREREDVERANESLAAVRAQLAELETELRAEVAAFESSAEAKLVPLELKPKKSDTAITRVALLWCPP